jgi:ribonuclease HI
VKILYAFIDGASRGNPGKAGVGVLIFSEYTGFRKELFRYLGTATNNQAEYSALILLLNEIIENKNEYNEVTHLIVHSDSELLVRQMNGRYKIKSENILKYHLEVRKLLGVLKDISVVFKNVPRSENADADKLANRAIDEFFKNSYIY